MTNKTPRIPDSGFIMFLKYFSIIIIILLLTFMIVTLFNRCTIVNLGTMEAKVNVDSLQINRTLNQDTTDKGGDLDEGLR